MASDDASLAAACAAEQAEELVALREIYQDACEVQSEEPGEVSFALQIAVDLGTAGVCVQVADEGIPEGGADEDGAPAAGASAGEAQAGGRGGGGGGASVMQLARQRLYGGVGGGAGAGAGAAAAAGAPSAPAGAAAALERSKSGRSLMEVRVKSLPPLTLQVSLPADYPAQALPDFHLASLWLSAEQLARLCAEMDQRAEEIRGSPVVFTWVEMLRSEAAEILGLGEAVTLAVSDGAPDVRAVAECTNLRAALMEILVYNQRRELDIWRQETHCCGICFSDKPGSHFTQMDGCTHTFCKECIGDMARIFVKEGTISELRCPDPKCRCEIGPNALAEVLSEDAYARWERLKMQSILTTELKGVVFCPRCEEHGWETPVLAQEATAEGEAPLAECSRCEYVFCGKCLAIYHTSLADCASPEERAALAAIRREEAKGSKDPMEKRRLAQLARGCVVKIGEFDAPLAVDVSGYLTEERDKGKKGDQILSVSQPCGGGVKKLWIYGENSVEELQKALAAPPPLDVRVRPPREGLKERERSRRLMEELLSLRALAKDSQNCPSCHAIIQRSEGCNHMTCIQCRTHFCYKCGKTLDPGNPYSHFSSGGCPTFDTQEVQRIAAQERFGGDDAELARLRREFGDQQELFAAFQRDGVARRRPPTQQNRRAQGETLCPTCGHWNGRVAGLNNIRCPTCRTSYCHHCRKRIAGVISHHYRGEQACPQHWKPEPAAAAA